MNKIDHQLDKISEKLALKLDEYLIGEIPDEFEIDDVDETEMGHD